MVGEGRKKKRKESIGFEGEREVQPFSGSVVLATSLSITLPWITWESKEVAHDIMAGKPARPSFECCLLSVVRFWASCLTLPDLSFLIHKTGTQTPTARRSTGMIQVKCNPICKCLGQNLFLVVRLCCDNKEAPKSQRFTSTDTSFLRTGLHWFPAWLLIQWLMMEEQPLSKASSAPRGEQAPRGTELSHASTLKPSALTCLPMLHLPE